MAAPAEGGAARARLTKRAKRRGTASEDIAILPPWQFRICIIVNENKSLHESRLVIAMSNSDLSAS